MRREQREIHSPAIPGRAERVGQTLADAAGVDAGHRPPFRYVMDRGAPRPTWARPGVAPFHRSERLQRADDPRRHVVMRETRLVSRRVTIFLAEKSDAARRLPARRRYRLRSRG